MNLHLVQYMSTQSYDIVYNTLEEMYYIKSKTSDVLQGGYKLAADAIAKAEEIRKGKL